MQLLVLDLSNNNAAPNFAKVAKWRGSRGGETYRVDGIIHKATEGATFVDPDFKRRCTAARVYGLRAGGYHFARPAGSDAVEEGRHFARTLGQPKIGDYRPMLDLERNDGKLSWRELEAWARAFNAAVFSAIGHLCGFYASRAWIDSMAPDKPIGAALWLAAWSGDGLPPIPVKAPAPWRRVQLHQFTSEASFPSPLHPDGVPGRVDINRVVRLRPLLAYPDELDL